MNLVSDEFVTDTSSEKWVRTVNWKASIPASLATLSFVLSLDGGPSCNFVVLKSPLLQQDQHFGLWYYLASERVPPTYEIEDVCRLYQSTADLGGMWEASRILWFLSIIPGFILTCTLWRMLITPTSKYVWGFLTATCALSCFLEIVIICLFLYGHACYGNQMMLQGDSSCTLATGSYMVIFAAIMWSITLLTMGYFPPYIKQTDPKVDEDMMGISVSARKNGLIELQVCERENQNISGVLSGGGSVTTPKILDMEIAKTEIDSAASNTKRLSERESTPPDIDEVNSFNKFVTRAESSALACSVNSNNSISSSDAKPPNHNDSREEVERDDEDSHNLAEKWERAKSSSSLDVGSVHDLEDRFA